MPNHDADTRLNRLQRQTRKRTGQAPRPKDLDEALAIAQQLQVHQEGLELQNQELRRAQEELAEAQEQYQKLFDLAPVGFLVLDLQGIILEANRAAINLLGGQLRTLEGASFLAKVEKNSSQAFKQHFIETMRREGGAGSQVTLSSPGRPVVYMQSVALDRVDHRRGYLTALVDISERVRAERELSASREELATLTRKLEKMVSERTIDLEAQTRRLSEANTALKVLLENREQERREIEKSITANLNRLVRPLLERLRQADSRLVRNSLIEALDKHLQDLTSNFTPQLISAEYILSSRELEVAGLIRQGKTSDEIADILCISPSSVQFHRGNIRSKMGIKGKKIRLSSYLRRIS